MSAAATSWVQGALRLRLWLNHGLLPAKPHLSQAKPKLSTIFVSQTATSFHHLCRSIHHKSLSSVDHARLLLFG